MLKLDLLDALNDSELDEIEAYSQAQKKKRDEERKSKAMEEARAILEAAGINFTDLKGKPRGRPAKVVKARGKRQTEAS